ncbi:chaplin [Streptomyces glaucus]|uniref:LAXTG-anchored chaplin ChpB n=1 Tax=Streptomyces glaucus TaxID=284029 RepID=A0ABP5XFZ9_9ACTN
MKRVTRNRVIAVAAASGAMAMTIPASAAFATDGGSAANGSAAGSPGLVSGNIVQLPVHAPVNVCGNTVNVLGALNPAAGNRCANEGAARQGHEGDGGAGGAIAEGGGKDAPGLLSGNIVQLPVHAPVNVSGNSVNVVGALNPATGNESVDTPGDRPDRPERPAKPVPEPVPVPERAAPPERRAQPRPAPPAAPPAPVALARTGADQTLPALAGSAVLVLGGAILYRRSRPRPQS